METLQIPWLTTIILFPLVAALAIPFIPDKDGKTIRWYSLAVGLTNLTLMAYAFSNNYSLETTKFQLSETYSWL
ncbi:MAG: NAD(P)H-quinone oxidoreductase subunit 4, partial [Xenococcaceae cyanobacterium]